MRKFLLLLLLTCFWNNLTGQMERTIYQSFAIDSATTIQFDLVGDYELVPWAGNTMLIETNIQIWNASPRILDFFIEHGRYEIVQQKSPHRVQLVSRNPHRQLIRTKDGECIEIVRIKIFVPDAFTSASHQKNLLTKKHDDDSDWSNNE